MAIPAALLALVPDFMKGLFGIIDDCFTSDEEKAAAKLQMTALLQQHEAQIIEAQKDVIVAEAKSEHWITSTWRPITMLVFTTIVANNYIIYPYLNLIFDTGIMLALPPDLWALLKIGLGGYVVGRSAEKAVIAWNNKPKGDL